MAGEDLSLLKGVLDDLFARVQSLVGSVTQADEEAAGYRPDGESNTMAWLLWHLIRIQDDHVSDLMDTEQVWTSQGWYDRFGLPFDATSTGYGHSSEDVAAVRVNMSELAEYHAAVHARTEEYIAALTPAELQRVVDDAWDPPVTAGVRLISVASDALQHLGQAAYLQGLSSRATH